MSAGTFMHYYETIYFHRILTSISNLFRQFILTPPDLQYKKISSYPG